MPQDDVAMIEESEVSALLESLPEAEPASLPLPEVAVALPAKVVPRSPYSVTVVVRDKTLGPFAPAGGACDESEAKQRVLDDNSALKSMFTAGVPMRWSITRV